MKRLLVAATALIGVMGVQTGWAGSATSTIAVSADVPAACTISASPLAFGTLTPSNTFTATTTINVTCTNGGAYQVALDTGISGQGGLNLKGTVTFGYLPYGLYLDSNHTTAWNSGNVANGIGNGAEQSLTVYGQIITLSTLVSDTYADTVTATISY